VQLSNNDRKEAMSNAVSLRNHVEKIGMVLTMIRGSPLVDKEAQNKLENDLEEEQKLICLGELSRANTATLSMLPNVKRVQDEYSTLRSRAIEEQRIMMLDQQSKFKEQLSQSVTSTLPDKAEDDDAEHDLTVTTNSSNLDNPVDTYSNDPKHISEETALRQLKRICDLHKSSDDTASGSSDSEYSDSVGTTLLAVVLKYTEDHSQSQRAFISRQVYFAVNSNAGCLLNRHNNNNNNKNELSLISSCCNNERVFTSG
jgi:hypothetical protein